MNRILLPLLLLAIAAFYGSCGEHTHEAAAHADHTTSPADSTPATDHDALPPVTLNNGLRWQANPETTAGIANMVGILAAYDPSTGDPKALKAALEEEFGLIFERCTMTGEAHNQLHNYLLPIHHQLREFEATDVQRNALGEHLAAYGNYFE
ncbi:MAG: hypothetical protein IPM49_03820 [Flavobacteriales bacterium]|nr:hypothetical protein [Flavobacteriales bacterium]